jgi:putative transposase
MSRAERRALVGRTDPALPVSQQCRLLTVSRSPIYRRSAEVGEEDRTIMALIDQHYLARPYYGSRRMAAQGHLVNRKRAQRLMRLMGLVAIYQRPNASKAAAEHKDLPVPARWPRAFSTWWSSWTGSGARCWRGDCRTRSAPIFASRRSRRRSPDTARPRFSIPTRAASVLSPKYLATQAITCFFARR